MKEFYSMFTNTSEYCKLYKYFEEDVRTDNIVRDIYCQPFFFKIYKNHEHSMKGSKLTILQQELNSNAINCLFDDSK